MKQGKRKKQPDSAPLGGEKERVAGLVDEALRISKKRKDTLARLREALLADDMGAVRLHASVLCGFSDEEMKKGRRKKSRPESERPKASIAF